MTKPKAVDLVAKKGNQKLAFEIETGKNSLEQIVQNLSKNLCANCEKVYLIPTTPKARQKIFRVLGYATDYSPVKTALFGFNRKPRLWRSRPV